MERHLGKELAHDLLYGVKRSLLLIDGSEYERVLTVTERHGIVEAARKQSSDRRWRLELAWRMTDDLLVGGVARLQIGLGRGQGRQSLGAAGLGLGHVGARHLAHIETILGRLELLGEHSHIVLTQTHDSRVAHDIDIGGHRVEQHRLFDAAQALARSLDRRLRPSDGVQILEALKQRLSELHRNAPRVGRRVGDTAASWNNYLVRWSPNCGGRNPWGDPPCMLEGYVTLSANERAQPGLGERHLLVGRSLARSLLRTGLIR